jgi:hypothetical protein
LVCGATPKAFCLAPSTRYGPSLDARSTDGPVSSGRLSWRPPSWPGNQPNGDLSAGQSRSENVVALASRAESACGFPRLVLAHLPGCRGSTGIVVPIEIFGSPCRRRTRLQSCRSPGCPSALVGRCECNQATSSLQKLSKHWTNRFPREPR